MDIDNLLNLLDNKTKKIKLLFVTPSYDGVTVFDEIDTSYFNPDRFNCHIVYIKSVDIPTIIENAKNYDCVVNLC